MADLHYLDYVTHGKQMVTLETHAVREMGVEIVSLTEGVRDPTVTELRSLLEKTK